MTPKIESRSNDKIKAAAVLADSSKARRQSGEFLLEGLRLCGDAVVSGIRIHRLFFTEKAMCHDRFNQIFAAAEESYEISDDVCSRLSQTQNSQGIFCVCRIPGNKLDITGLSDRRCYVALENIRDPANLGAICRTAEALGISGAVMSGCCDIYNPKAQRAAMGSLLRLPVLVTDELCSLLDELKSHGTAVYASTPDASAENIKNCSFENGGIAVIGNEANGVSEQVMRICTPVTIPMRGRAESLNASMAAALVMWEMLR